MQSTIVKYSDSPTVPNTPALVVWVSPQQEIPELDGALSEPPPIGSENTENDKNNESEENNENPPEVTVGETGGNASQDDENPTGLEEGGEQENASSGVAGAVEEVTRHSHMRAVILIDILHK